MTAPSVTTSVSAKKAAKALVGVSPHLSRGEQVRFIAAGNSFLPLCDLVVVTSARVLLVQSADVERTGIKKQIAGDTIGSFDLRSRMGGWPTLRLVDRIGAEHGYGQVKPADVVDLERALTDLVHTGWASPATVPDGEETPVEVMRFQTPPGWPTPPAGWEPPDGWAPEPSWPPAPAGWQFWLPATAPPPVVAAPPPTPLPVAPPPATAPTAVPPAPIIPPPAANAAAFGGRKKALETENAQLREALVATGAVDDAQRAARNQQLTAELQSLTARIAQANVELAAVQADLINTSDVALLQSAGVYAYAHPLEDAVGYKDLLARLKDDTKSFVRNGEAVLASTNWQVNGSMAEGKKMVGDFSKLLLRAYNAEADNCVRTVRPHSRHTSVERLAKVSQTIARLGKTMNIHISDRYHQLRCQEIVLTADYRAKVEAEKEDARALREEMREQAAAARDFERAQAKWDKEQTHVESALAALTSRGDGEGEAALRLRERLDEIEAGRAEVEALAANARGGHVYVISNVGAFGDGVVKIGMTRRLDPQDRIRELGDASVPFRFDVHALVQNHDAVGLERALHAHFADRRLNQVNLRREFFRATPAEVLQALQQIPNANVVEFTELPEAAEWRASTPKAEPT
jgi:hypothetical protein